jgi:hypothetical protein
VTDDWVDHRCGNWIVDGLRILKTMPNEGMYTDCQMLLWFVRRRSSAESPDVPLVLEGEKVKWETPSAYC